MEQLTITEKVGANYILLELNGTVTAYTVNELQEKVYNYILDTNVVLDMSQVYQLDSAGVGIIIGAHNDGEGSGTKVYILNPSDYARHSLERTGFMDTFNVISSVMEITNA
ncbi:MAG: STAS domain-containing protein [Treponema sp.]|nr:STAS domain-containing protein [Treponema sp.]